MSVRFTNPLVSWKLFSMPSSSKWLPYARPVRSPKVTVHSLPARPPSGPQVAAQAQQVVDGVRACGRLVAVVDGAEVSDPGASDLAGKLRAENRLRDAPRVDETVGRVELLEPLE